ncbi:hypothetical protein [Vibrio vulnificus YJ016]|uniref:Uncharacterized protein n=1 Tax=Vibrio vulnificus (strain YJ016) TaxID=196600 RepID=Q7MC97_VIBVY|nr:hypothetical protein [Vibrio vulnificus YJ016]
MCEKSWRNNTGHFPHSLDKTKPSAQRLAFVLSACHSPEWESPQGSFFPISLYILNFRMLQ